MRLREGFSVTGTVEDSVGVGQVGIDIEVVNLLTGETIFLNDNETGALGAFDIPLPEGPMELTFKPAPTSALVPQIRTIDVSGPPAVNSLGLE